MMTRQILLTATAAMGSALLAAGNAQAQSFPSTPIKLVLPYTAGSPNDVFARLVGPYLSSRLGQPVVIDNRPGGGTTIGLKTVMAAEPDGHTLLFSNTPTHVIAPMVVKGFTYDPLKAVVPIATIGSSANVMVIGMTVPATTLPEFIRYAMANPGKLNFGFGQGTIPQLIGEAFKLAAGVEIASIPYRGGAQAITDMLGGRIHMNIGAGATLVPLSRAGKVRAVAVTSATRNPELPEVPTMIENGLPELTTMTYYGIFGPPGMPADIVVRTQP